MTVSKHAWPLEDCSHDYEACTEVTTIRGNNYDILSEMVVYTCQKCEKRKIGKINAVRVAH